MADESKPSDIIRSQTQSLATKPSTVVSRGLALAEAVTQVPKPPPIRPLVVARLKNLVRQHMNEQLASVAQPHMPSAPTPYEVELKPGEVELDPADGREMVFVPAGEFIMGTNDSSWDNEKPQHRVSVPGFWIDKVPVTNEAYNKFLDANPQHAAPHRTEDWAQPYNWDGKLRTFPPARAFHPVALVSWDDAVAYCQWASKRLPTEAEWEKAARGTDGREWPWGNQFDAARCNTYEGGLQTTTPVGAYPTGASPYGCLDMAGNVWEWCSSVYVPYPYQPGDGREDPHERSRSRVLRGGSWDYDMGHARCALRARYVPGARGSCYGFRCAMTA